MDFTQKPLSALRDLALRMGIRSATSYRKTELIQKIEERKVEMEKGFRGHYSYTLGRPHLNNNFIEIVRNEDGTITFCDEERFTNGGVAKPAVETPTPPPTPSPLLSLDPIIRDKLSEAADILRTLYLAIDTILENS